VRKFAVADDQESAVVVRMTMTTNVAAVVSRETAKEARETAKATVTSEASVEASKETARVAKISNVVESVTSPSLRMRIKIHTLGTKTVLHVG